MTDTFSISSSAFGLIIGGISLLGLIINVVRFHLPSNKIKVLESLLDETETFFKKAIEDGLLIEPNFVRDTEESLAMLKDRTCHLQTRAYTSTTLSQDYSEFFRGTSTAIGSACQTLKRIRAEVISSSEEGRRRSRHREISSARQPSPPVQPLNPEIQDENRATLPPAADIARPHSCPPIVSAWRFADDTQSIATRSDTFNNPMQIDSDVQTTDVSDDTSTVCTSDNLEHEA